MIVVKLLSVRIQPTFVLVDTDTHDVSRAPGLTPVDLPASDLDELGEVLAQAQAQIEAQLAQSSRDVLLDS